MKRSYVVSFPSQLDVCSRLATSIVFVQHIRHTSEFIQNKLKNYRKLNLSHDYDQRCHSVQVGTDDALMVIFI